VRALPIPRGHPGAILMTNSRSFLPILIAVLLGGGAHAGEFSLGGARLLAQTSAQAGVDMTVNFTDRGHAMNEPAEGGDAPVHDARTLRGADEIAAPETSERPTPAAAVRKSPEPAVVTTDSPHGVSISPSTTIRRPSYRWQSLVPGTIK
jgi:hypothetical protein